MPVTCEDNGAIRALHLSADEPGRTLSVETVAETCAALVEYEENPSLKVATLESVGPDFGSLSLDRGIVAPPYGRISKPVVVGIRGRCAGEVLTMVAALTSVRISGESAAYSFGAGLAPGDRLTERSGLDTQVWHAAAMWLTLARKELTAAEALRVGLVTKVVADREVETVVRETAEWISKLLPVALMTDRAGARITRDLAIQDGMFLLYGDYVLAYHQPVSWEETWGLHATSKGRR